MSKEIKLNEPFDLKKTLECGQTFFWKKNPNGKYYTVRNGGVLKVWQEKNILFTESLGKRIDPTEVLRLDDPLEKIYNEIRKDKFIEKAVDENKGLRIINDKFFPCLISYITSAQMQISRIKKIQNELARKYGRELKFENKSYNQFPQPEDLAKVDLNDLKKLGLGYRAKYIKETARMIRDGEVKENELMNMKYGEAKEKLLKLHGVGDKVSDCVLLFSLGFLQAFPIDTWMWKVIGKKYPDFQTKNYSETSEGMREYFEKYAGYAHEYLFHYGRTCMNFD